MKKIILFFLPLLLFSCATVLEESLPLKIGKEDFTDITLHRQSELKLLLSGGSGKYRMSEGDKTIVKAEIHKDTLIIQALLEGSTYILVTTQDQERKLTINVTYPPLSFSTDSIRLYPKDQSKFVSLFGGDPFVKLTKEDPEDILDFKWNASTNIVEINAHYEGEATIIATAQDGDTQKIKVLVKAEDEPQEWGIYGTGGRFFSNNLSINNVFLAHQPFKGIWISSVADPNGGYAYTYSGTVLKINPIINPKVGDSIDLVINHLLGPSVGIDTGIYKAIVEEVKPTGVILRSRRNKFYLPYDTTQ